MGWRANAPSPASGRLEGPYPYGSCSFPGICWICERSIKGVGLGGVKSRMGSWARQSRGGFRRGHGFVGEVCKAAGSELLVVDGNGG